MTIVTRTTGDGRTLEIGIQPSRSGSYYVAVAALNGVPAATGAVQALPPAVAGKLPAGFTHCILGDTQIALRTAEAETLLAAIRAAEQADSKIRAEALRDRRRQLVGDIQAAIEEQADAYEAAHAREDALAEQIKGQHEPAIDAARDALATFDAEHPDVLAQIRAEQQERTERFLRVD